MTMMDTNSITSAWSTRVASESLSYAQRCYSKTRSEGGTCASFQLPFVPFTNKTVPCPFTENMCALPDAFQVDSGFVDSDKDLGINLPPRNRVSFRKVITCVPTLAEENFSSPWVEQPPALPIYNDAVRGDAFKYYNLGRGIHGLSFTAVASNYSEWVAFNDYNIL